MKYTFARRRLVTQVQTVEYEANTMAEAIAMANSDNDDRWDGRENEWYDCDDSFEYPKLGEEDIIDESE